MEKIRLFGILHIIGNIIRKEIKMDVINEYEQVLIGNLPKIPQRLFQNEPSANEHLALSVFRYAIEKLLRWTPMEAYRLFSPAVIETMKLTQLLNYINFPTELTKDNTEYIVYLIYPKEVPYDFAKYVIKVYRQVLNGDIRYPREYMYGNKGLVRAGICLQYAIKNNMVFHSVEEMYRFFCSPEGLTFLREKKLYQLYKSFYKTPVQFLHFSLPDSLKSELYYNYYTFLINYKKKYGELPPCTS